MTTGTRCVLVACFLVTQLTSSVLAGPLVPAMGKIIGDAELAEMRGGYVGSDGLEVSIGIIKSLTVDGALKAVSTLNIPLLGGSGMAESGQGSVIQLVQSGLGNSIAPTALSGLQPGMFTIVQNSLDGAVIKNLTQINATVNVLTLYRNMNLTGMINQQMINSMR